MPESLDAYHELMLQPDVPNGDFYDVLNTLRFGDNEDDRQYRTTKNTPRNHDGNPAARLAIRKLEALIELWTGSGEIAARDADLMRRSRISTVTSGELLLLDASLRQAPLAEKIDAIIERRRAKFKKTVG